ncbi:hypothetical protein BGW80DRAFT_1247245 [Lactifluus volemus]|nr:hypothetical protein BGW80DRAFT_1247245 [Lactifluus volemus]
MVDGPPGQLNTSERLSLLRSYEATWRNLEWNDHTSFPVPEGHFGNLRRGNKGIIFVQLPSRLRGIPMRRWTLDFDFTIRDFGIDPSQDLLVTVENLIHQDSAGHTIVSSYSIRVSADYVGILFLYHDDENELIVWNWKTGAKCLVAGSLDILSFTFLGHRFVLTSALEFVRLHCYFTTSTRELIVAKTTLTLIFYASHSKLAGWIGYPSDIGSITRMVIKSQAAVLSNQTFLFPASALLEYVNDTPMEGGGRNIEWESWGPRCCDELVPGHGSWDGWQLLIVRDLCPRRYMRASDVEREESNALERELGSQGSCSRSILKWYRGARVTSIEVMYGICASGFYGI